MQAFPHRCTSHFTSFCVLLIGLGVDLGQLHFLFIFALRSDISEAFGGEICCADLHGACEQMNKIYLWKEVASVQAMKNLRRQ